MYATTNGAPVKDLSQDVTLLSSLESNGITKINFRRKLNTCDNDNDNEIKVRTLKCGCKV